MVVSKQIESTILKKTNPKDAQLSGQQWFSIVAESNICLDLDILNFDFYFFFFCNFKYDFVIIQSKSFSFVSMSKLSFCVTELI